MFHIKLMFVAALATLALAKTNPEQNDVEPRIENGQYAERGQFPFYVYLEVSSSLLTFKTNKKCGASLISSQWVLTAALCVSDDRAKIRLHLGSLRADDETEFGRKTIDVSSDDVHVHPNYSAFLGISNPKHDIALIKLPSPVKFSKFISSVPLACPKSLSFGGSVMTIGNARDKSDSSNVPKMLRYADLKVTDLNEEFIFAVGLNKEKTRIGDAGGPLVVLGDKGDIHGLVGVLTSGHHKTKIYGDFKTKGFARIAAYFDWIKSLTGITTCLQ